MSPAITQARQYLAGILEAALEGHDAAVVDHVPEELAPPTVVVDAGDDYLTRGETFAPGDWWLTMRVYVLVDLAANVQAIEDLEDLLGRVLPALEASAWELDPIGRPEEFHTLTWLAHGTRITVRTLITIQENP